MLAVRSSERLRVWTEEVPGQVRADRLASQVDEGGLGPVRCGAAAGARGPRVCDWAWVALRPLREPAQGHWLLSPLLRCLDIQAPGSRSSSPYL